jgi:hypothetical protein
MCPPPVGPPSEHPPCNVRHDRKPDRLFKKGFSSQPMNETEGCDVPAKTKKVTPPSVPPFSVFAIAFYDASTLLVHDTWPTLFSYDIQLRETTTTTIIVFRRHITEKDTHQISFPTQKEESSLRSFYSALFSPFFFIFFAITLPRQKKKHSKKRPLSQLSPLLPFSDGATGNAAAGVYENAKQKSSLMEYE